LAREKVSGIGVEREVIYSPEHWAVLRAKRERALRLAECLYSSGLDPIVHGSVARGDVTPKSDVDVVVPYPVPSYKVEIALESCGYTIYERRVVMATPSSTPKAYYILDPQELVQVSFPIVRLQQRELEFYQFGGSLSLSLLREGKRVPGVNKRLELVVPTERGHALRSVIGREAEVAKLLGISLETVMERVRVLTRRDEVGRTGVYVDLKPPPDESVEEALLKLSRTNPAVRKAIEERV